MNNKKIISGLIILIIIAIVFSLIVFMFNKPKEAKLSTTPYQQVSQKKEMPKDTQKTDEENVQAELRKKIETENIALSIRGIIKSFDKDIVNFTTLDGKELELKIIQEKILDSVESTDGPVEIDSGGKVTKKGTVFMKKNGDNLEEIKNFKLENISQGQEIGITYMTLSKEIVQITVE